MSESTILEGIPPYTDPSAYYGDGRSTNLGTDPDTSHIMINRSNLQELIYQSIDRNETHMITMQLGMSDTGHVVHAQV